MPSTRRSKRSGKQLKATKPKTKRQKLLTPLSDSQTQKLVDVAAYRNAESKKRGLIYTESKTKNSKVQSGV